MIFDPHAKLLWNGKRTEEFMQCGRTSPILVEIAPTGYCNAKCPWCFFKEKHSKERIDPEIMKQAIMDLSLVGVKAINWTGGGEPTLHPQFNEFVKLTQQLHLKQGLFTNAYQEIPNQEAFSWIRVSLTDEGFKRIVKPKVPFGVCVNQTKNQLMEELADLCISAQSFGASYFQIRPALLGSYEKQPNLMVPYFLEGNTDENFKVYVTDYKYEGATKPFSYSECYGYHFCPSIDWNGNVSSCLYLTQDPEFQFGNLKEKSFLEIWPKIPSSISVSTKCQNCCKNNQVNKILFKSKQMEHIEFL